MTIKIQTNCNWFFFVSKLKETVKQNIDTFCSLIFAWVFIFRRKVQITKKFHFTEPKVRPFSRWRSRLSEQDLWLQWGRFPTGDGITPLHLLVTTHLLRGRVQKARTALFWRVTHLPISIVACKQITELSPTSKLQALDDDDCFYYYKKWFSTLDWGSMRSNLLFLIWDYRWFAFSSVQFNLIYIFCFSFSKEKIF